MRQAPTSADGPRELRRALAWASRRKLLARLTNLAIVCVTAAFLAGLVGALVLMWGAYEELQAVEGAPRLPGLAGQMLTLISIIVLVVFLILPFYVYFGLLVLPFILALPLGAPVITLWRDPRRFLLLRPFNRRWLSRPVRRLVRRHVAPFGHVYTLADANIKVPWYVRVPVLFGQLSLFSFRLRKIRRAAHIERLARAMRRTGWRNLNWCLSSSKFFPVACHDACWRECVTRLVSEVDVILVDLSHPSEHIVWEVELCRGLGLEERMLFLVRRDVGAAGAGGADGRRAVEAAPPLGLFEYDAAGLADPASFRAAVAEITLREPAVGTRPPAAGRASVLATLLFSLGAYPLLAAPLLPAGEDGPGAASLLILAFGVVTWGALLAAARRNPAAWLLFGFQALLVGGVALVLWG